MCIIHTYICIIHTYASYICTHNYERINTSPLPCNTLIEYLSSYESYNFSLDIKSAWVFLLQFLYYFLKTRFWKLLVFFWSCQKEKGLEKRSCEKGRRCPGGGHMYHTYIHMYHTYICIIQTHT